VTDHNPLYADSCDNCVRATAPESAIPDGTGTSIVAGYRCPHCRATWTCSWTVVPGRPIPPPPRDDSFIDRHLNAQVHEQAAINRAHRHLAPKEPS
jgi:hypothetical protein